ncbi:MULTISPECIES: type II and III secretion system protein family protein [Sphingobium]|uniref:type II and III secretion system protein family protein n=1 Tax=Sphingobium TaxID=165695 RepID=UPI0017E13A15|nr:MULTISPECIES: type II and III secretion system protein family protein [Sphingobium]MCW2363312.1 pilus assembly protein CpaC [Sphingobium sp. B10D3B]MCW2368109.1 pilus assembly protein CpaC [Sphingobium sp. B11D3D]MCW2406986.1 pilus assembly protein CpaC [Sphingobium xanthum]
MNSPSRLRMARTATGVLATALALTVSATVAPALHAQATMAPKTDGTLLLAVGESRVINLPANLTDVVIANPNVVDVHVRSQRQVYLIAKASGETNVFITARDGKMLYANAVRVGNNITSIDQMLRLAMPESDVQVNTMNGMVLLTGTVAAPEDAAEVQRLVQAFSGADTNVVSRLRTATPLQVNLQVRIAEVNKNFTKSLGFNILTQDTTGGFQFGIGRGNPGSLATGQFNVIENGTSMAFAGNLLGLNVLSTLDLAENQGLAVTLANPNLTALSGETASFLAGGEVPIPIATQQQVSVEYKQYGVSLAFTPTVLANGRISMRVRPEVSQLDSSSAVRVSGFDIPGIQTRRAETTVELGSGQSFMIGGLLSTASGNTIEKTPFLGDIPILGNLFKSQSYRRQETELVIIVTPYLVRPVDARQIALPTDGYRNADDAQRILGGQIQDGRSGDARPTPQALPPKTVEQGSVAARSGNAAPGFSF